MKSDLYNLINTFSNYHVLVLGEAMLDSYLEGTSERLCREAPVPVVIVNGRLDVPGGAANTAVNVRSLGGKTTFLSVVGRDSEGETIKKVLRDKGVSVEHLLMKSSRITLAKHRVIAGSQMVVRFDQGSTGDIDRKIENELIARLNETVPGMRCAHPIRLCLWDYHPEVDPGGRRAPAKISPGGRRRFEKSEKLSIDQADGRKTKLYRSAQASGDR